VRERAAAEEDHARFVKRVVAGELVWGLRNARGFVACESNDDVRRPVLMFWSDRAYAERTRKHRLEETETASISLFDFLFRFLTGMAQDKARAGTNWSGELIGLEIEPEQLQDEIIEAMPVEQRQRYLQMLKDGFREESK
jgi:hypothetical protein